jgi:hypothetical protein
MVATVALLETVFHAVDGFGDRDLAEEELCRTEKVRQEFLALAQADLHWFIYIYTNIKR